MDRIQADFATIQSKDLRQQTDISPQFKQADHKGWKDVHVHILDFIYASSETRQAAIL